MVTAGAGIGAQREAFVCPYTSECYQIGITRWEETGPRFAFQRAPCACNSLHVAPQSLDTCQQLRHDEHMKERRKPGPKFKAELRQKFIATIRQCSSLAECAARIGISRPRAYQLAAEFGIKVVTRKSLDFPPDLQ